MKSEINDSKMNATIQEIEGIDDYWGPAFRSVYEGEGHEAFVQQLDDRIVQHDKEIEKLCNFHYQPKNTKRQRRPMKPVKSAGSQAASKRHCSGERTASSGHHTHLRHNQDGKNNRGAKRRRVDPRRLGGYSNMFPAPGNSHSGDASSNPLNAQNVDRSPDLNDSSNDESCSYDGYTDGTPELDEDIEANGNWEVAAAGTLLKEYEEIAEYHALAEQQKSQQLVVEKEPDVNSTSDLRLYLRNRKRASEVSAECRQSQSRPASQRHLGQSRCMSERHLSRDRESSVEHQRGRSRGSLAELRRGDRQDPSDCSTSTNHHRGSRDASTEQQRLRRRDAIDERHRGDSRDVSTEQRRSRLDAIEERHHGNSSNASTEHHRRSRRDGFDERHHGESHHTSASFQVGHDDFDKLHRGDSRGEPASTSRIVYVERQPNCDASTECHYNPAVPVENEHNVNSSSDLRSYLSSKLSEVDNNFASNDTIPRSRRSRARFRSRRRRRLNIQVRSDASSREASVFASNSSEHNQHSHESAERHHGGDHYASHERHHDESRHVSAESHYSQSRHESSASYHDESHHASGKLYLDHDRRLPAEVELGETCNVFAEGNHTRSRPLSTEFHNGQSRHESSASYHGESHHASGKLYLDHDRRLPGEVELGETCHVFAEGNHTRSRPLSTEFHNSRHESTESYHSERHHMPAELHFDQNLPLTAELQFGDTSHGLADRHHTQKRPLSAERRHSWSRSLSDHHQAVERHYNESRHTSTARYHGQSFHESTERHHNKSRHTSAKRRHCQSRPLSAELQLDETCRGLAEHQTKTSELYYDQRRPLFAERHHSKSRHTSTERQHCQSRPLSAELQFDETCHGLAERQTRIHPSTAELYYDQKRPLSAERRHSRPLSANIHQSRRTSTELHHDWSHPFTAEINHGQRCPLFAEIRHADSPIISDHQHVPESRDVSVELHHSQRCLMSAELLLGQSRPLSTKPHYSQNHHVFPELHNDLSRPLSAETNNGQRHPLSAELHHDESSLTSERQHYIDSRHLSVDLDNSQRHPLSAELHLGKTRPLSAETNHDQRRPLSTELHHGESGITSERQHDSERHVAVSVEVNHSQTRPLSADLHLGQSHPLSAEPHHSQNHHISAEVRHDDKSLHLSAELHHSQINPLSAESYLGRSHHASAERQHGLSLITSGDNQHDGESRRTSVKPHDVGSRHAPTEAHFMSTMPVKESKPIDISTNSEESSCDAATVYIGRSSNGDVSAERHCSPIPDVENNNIDLKSNLRSYIKPKLTCRREACADLPRGRATSSESRDHSRDASTERRHSQRELDFERFDTARRQCSTPEPDVKIELNDNTSNDVADSRNASASVSCNVSTGHHPSLSKDELQCSLPETNVKREPNENCTNTGTYSQRASPGVLNEVFVGRLSNCLPKNVPLTVYSRRHPNQSRDASTKRPLEPNAICVNGESPDNSSNTVTSSEEACIVGLNDASARSQLSYKMCPKEHQTSAKKHQRTQKERQCILSVRDVDAINLSCIQSKHLIINGAKNNPLNAIASSHETEACERGHSDASYFADCRSFSPPKLSVESEPNTQHRSSLNAAVSSCDPRPLLKNNCDASTDGQYYPLKRDEQTNEETTGNTRCESNINSLNNVGTSRDPRLRPRHGCDPSTDHQNIRLNPDVQNKPNSTPMINELPSKYNEVVDKVVEGLPDFDPLNKSQRITAWISRINEIALTCNWTDKQVVEYAMSKLAGNAKSWYEGFTSNLSWNEWQNKFKAAFPPEENYGKMLLDMLSKTAKVGDSLEDYYCEKIVMLNNCSIRGKRAVECIIFGIEDEAVRTKAEAENVDDLEKLLAFLQKNNDNNCAVEIIYNDLGNP